MTAGMDVFREAILPQRTRLVGTARLVAEYGLAVPVREPSVVSDGSVRGSRREEDGWTVFDKRYAPGDDFASQLGFSIRHEPFDLLFLKRLFAAVGRQPVEEMVRSEPTGSTARKVWYLYETLTGETLDIPDAKAGNYVEVLDPAQYFTARARMSPRHRVRDNLLGTPAFCPVIRRTEELADFVGSRWDTQAREKVGRISDAVVARAASFLLLADSQASYQIEGERPPRNRLERWMKVVEQAGRRPLSVGELERLQAIVVEGDRFITPGLRQEGGFIGQRDYDNNPLPEFISARHEDVRELLEGILEANARMTEAGVDAVLQAACTAFGFVFVHPFEDGNGRVHRYLMHHVLAESRFTPVGVTFPISSVLLDRQEEYGKRLREFSAPLLPFIEWVPTERKNVRVLNETADLYRYGDYTELAGFLYRCVARTISEDLPREISYLKAFDAAREGISASIEMPDNTLSLLINLVRQNGGSLARKRRENEFRMLTDDEVAFVEETVREAFGDHDDRTWEGPGP